MNPTEYDIPTQLNISFPSKVAAPSQFSVALSELQKWFLSNGLTRSECSTVMECHVKLSREKLSPDGEWK